MKRVNWLIGVLILGSVLAIILGPLAAQAVNSVRPLADFNGDRYADLAIGTPFETVNGEDDAGAVNVLYGAASTGLTTNGSQLWDQNITDVLDESEVGDVFGYALADGDFNGDGYVDMAVGVSEEDVETIDMAGAVQVFYGSADGLAAAGNQLWRQGVDGILDSAEAYDMFGVALAAGDFDGNGYADLAIGAPGEDIGTVVSAGVVHILYGSAGGLTAAGNQLWHQNSPGINGAVAEDNDLFGSALTTGDFNGDGRADLAVGVPLEAIGSEEDAGAMHILYGSDGGLSATDNQVWYQGSSDVADAAEARDQFGRALAAGDSNGDGYDDLAVGVPYEDVGSSSVITDAGAVHIFYGSPDVGLTATDNWLLDQNYLGVMDTAEVDDRFGWTLTIGDFDGNGKIDVAVGVPLEDVGSSPVITNAGAVHIMYSSTLGKNELWYQGKSGVADTAEAEDQFGHALAAGDFNDDGYTDLAVGAPFENREGVSPLADVGVVHILYGSTGGLSNAGNQLWYQDSPDIGGVGEAQDRFGYALAAIPATRSKTYLPLILR